MRRFLISSLTFYIIIVLNLVLAFFFFAFWALIFLPLTIVFLLLVRRKNLSFEEQESPGNLNNRILFSPTDGRVTSIFFNDDYQFVVIKKSVFSKYGVYMPIAGRVLNLVGFDSDESSGFKKFISEVRSDLSTGNQAIYERRFLSGRESGRESGAEGVTSGELITLGNQLNGGIALEVESKLGEIYIFVAERPFTFNLNMWVGPGDRALPGAQIGSVHGGLDIIIGIPRSCRLHVKPGDKVNLQHSILAGE